MKSKIPTVSLAAQENQPVIVDLAAPRCQKRPVYLASSDKPPQLTTHQTRVQTGCFEKHVLSTARNSLWSVLHLAWIPEHVLPIFRIIFRLHNSSKDPGLPLGRGCPAVKPLGSGRPLAWPSEQPRRTLPEPPLCLRQTARATHAHE